MRTDRSGGDSSEFVFDVNGRRALYWDVTHGWEIQGQTYWGSVPVEFYEAGYAQFQHQDWVGTERMRTTYNGGVAGSFTSLPYGDAFSASGNDWVAKHFTGLDRDYSSNTDHAQFRQYSNTQGRWLSPDPYSGSYDFSNPQSLNRYAYVMNNPVSFSDPLGLASSCSPEEGPTASWCITGMPGPSIGTWVGTGGGSTGRGYPVNVPTKVAKKLCGALPSGTITSISGNGNFVGTAGSLDVVTNLRTGEVTGFFSPGYFAGAMTAGVSLTSGYTFGNLGSGNTNFAGGFTGASGGYGIIAGAVSTSSGGPASPLSGINPKASGHVTTVSVGVQTPGRALGLNTTYSLPNQLGANWTLADPMAALMYVANQLCAAAGY